MVQVITLHLLCNNAFLCCFYFNFFVLKILYQHHKDSLTYYILKYYFPFIFRSRIHLRLTIAYETPVNFIFSPLMILGTTENEMAGWHYQLDGHEFE